MHNFELLNITPGWGDAQTDATDKPCFLTAAASLCVHTSRSWASDLHKSDCDREGSHGFAILTELSFPYTQDLLFFLRIYMYMLCKAEGEE